MMVIRNISISLNPPPSPLSLKANKFVMFLILNLQVVLTPTHLGIVMEYAASDELFERICNASRFSEDEVLLLSLTLNHSLYMCIILQ